MKQKTLFFSIIITISLCVCLGYTAYQYYAPPNLRQEYTTGSDEDGIHLAYIGDSWAALHKEYNDIIEETLKDSLHITAKVHSFGICGLTSKEIYDNMFDNKDFKGFFQKRRYKYCFISAGINDTYKKMSTHYYQQSMNNIILFMLNNNIHPIILEIPDYDIEKAYDCQKPIRKILRNISIYINNTPINCKQEYRDALDELISNSNYQDKVSIIRYKTWNNNYTNDLEQLYIGDKMHLNRKGYAKLDSVIAQEIIKDYH